MMTHAAAAVASPGPIRRAVGAVASALGRWASAGQAGSNHRGSPAANALAYRRFDAARIDRLTSDWWATTTSLNQELRSDLDALRARARQLVLNNDHARKFRGMVEDNIIGPTGIGLQALVEDAPGKPDSLASTAIERAWAEWSQACDVTGRLGLRDLCVQLIGGMPSDGEFLVRMVIGKEAGNAFGFALQAIDVDRIDTTYNTSHGGNKVVMGVELNGYGRPVALHLFEGHPADGANSSRQRIRVPAEEIIHAFKVERPEQARGIPWMAPGMLSLHHLGGFMLSAVLAAEHGANHFGFFTTPTGDVPLALVNEPADADGTAAVAYSQPGQFDTLPAGTSFQAYDSKYPSETFGPFVKTALQRVASGWRVAYHSLANDLEGVSFSSIRSGTLEERDRWAADQAWFIDTFLEPVYRQWLRMALLNGAITMPNGSALPAAKAAKFARHQWQPRRWDWVDPRGDMEANILAVQAGAMSPQQLAALRGNDFEEVIKASAQAQALAQQHGLTLTAYLPKAGQVALPGSASEPPANTATP